MGKPAAARSAVSTPTPPTPKATEHVVDVAPEQPPSPSPTTLLTETQLQEFVDASSSVDRLKILTAELRVDHYDANARSLVWVDFVFSVATFAIEETPLSSAKTLALLDVCRDLFAFATTPITDEPAAVHANASAFPTVDATYALFRKRVRVLSMESGDAQWSPPEVARVVSFLSVAFFRHLAAFQYVFEFPRASVEREVALVVERPLPAAPLAAATLQMG